MILYLLPFENGRHFKFGVTDLNKRGFDRPYLELDPLYEIDFSKALMVTANEKKEVYILENEIKRNYSRYFRTEEYVGKDGASEILPIEYFDEVISFIKEKARLIKWQGIKIENMPAPDPVSAVKEIKPKPHKERKKDPYWLTLGLMDFLSHPYGERLIALGKARYNQVIFFEKEMPGIFVFVNQICRLRVINHTTGGALQAYSYFSNDVSFYFDELGKAYVTFGLTQNFFEDIESGSLNERLKDFKPTSIDLNMLQEVAKPEEDLLLTDQTYIEKQMEEDYIAFQKSMDEKFQSLSKEQQEEIKAWGDLKKKEHLAKEKQKEDESKFQFEKFWNSLS